MDGREEMKVALKSSDQFPLPASLFMMNGNRPESTWDLFDKNRNRVDIIIRKQTEYGSKLMTFLCWNMVEPDNNPINPFIGNPTVKELKQRFYKMGDVGWDQAEVSRWKSVLSMGANPGVYLVPTIFCGDDRESTRDKEFVDWYVPIVIRALYSTSAAYNLISEASKSWDRSEIEYAVSVAKAAFDIEPKLAPKPVFVHQQGTDIGSKADGLMYEFKKNPWNANEYSGDEVINELRHVLSVYPKYVWPQELAVLCEKDWARDFSRRIRELAKTEPRIIGLPGPV